LREPIAPAIYVLCCALIWGATSLASTLAFRELNVTSLLCWGNGFSSAFFLLVILARGRISTLTLAVRTHGVKLLCLGALIASYYLLLFKGLHIGPAAPAYVVNFFWAIFILPLSRIFFGERIAAKNYLAIGVSFIGVAILICQGSFTAEISPAYPVMLTGAVLYALYSVLNKKWAIDRMAMLCVTLAVSCMCQIVIGMLNGTIIAPGSAATWAVVAYLGCFPMGLAHLLWLKALSGGNSAMVANLIYTAPLFNIIFMGTFTDQRMDYPSTIAGALIMIGGIVYQNYLRAKYP